LFYFTGNLVLTDWFAGRRLARHTSTPAGAAHPAPCCMSPPRTPSRREPHLPTCRPAPPVASGPDVARDHRSCLCSRLDHDAM